MTRSVSSTAVKSDRSGSSNCSSLSALPGLLANQAQAADALAHWRAGQEIWLSGVWEASRCLAAAMLRTQNRPLFVICPDGQIAESIASDLETFGIEDAVTVPFNTSEDTPEAIRDQDYAKRLQILQQLRGKTSGPVCPVITASATAAIQSVPSPNTLAKTSRQLTVGERLDPESLHQWLTEAGFHATTAVELPGEYSQRGGILDVFSADHPDPIRIELFGDDIESIRMFDVASQRSVASIESVEFSAINLDQSSGTVFDYLEANTDILIVDPESCRHAVDALHSRSNRSGAYLNWNGLLQRCSEFRLAMGTQLAEANSANLIDLSVLSVDSFFGEIEFTRSRIDEVGADHQVYVITDTPADNDRIGELLQKTKACRQGRLKIQIGKLSYGFRLDEPKVLVLTGAELFHRSPLRRIKRRVRSKPLDGFLQLEAGDLVVHLSHGIGIYRGLELIEKHGQKLEHLAIEFDGGTIIYVPAARIGLLQRYIGGSKSRPKLAKIGGQAWTRQRKAAEAAVTDMASDLLELQVKRETRHGIAFPPDSQWQQQFDASFPYTETQDQLRAISASKESMESTQPMDRLICGDVGFGKTEVAMRAAFKAVSAGYQVAVLVPTTVLAEQHYRTFCARMAEFPFDIVKLSRFATTAEQKVGIEGLRSGRVDIAIGTHRLASEDVHFNNLGLVIIDEEQRFGVQVKERLKTRHSNVDVMTLSATPIPRTLHMALVGVRDISNLETPPEDRLRVETRVTRWDEKLIRRAVVRELNRGGQIYFVHNRVGDIHVVAEKLRRIAPEAKIVIGHGQMHERELEKVMVDFVSRKYDILLATTIIESGLDIPNANTIFVDEADRYGLSDLHQLRGRVGRYKHQAYCYMLIEQHKHLTPNAAKRLRAIEEFSQMGAGFAISMRDLEIRGAGNLLGTQQSGHIAAVGYELYCQLLESAVRQAKRLPPKLSIDADIDLPVEAYLPDDYVPDLRQKIDIYRRLARMEQITDLQEMRAELLDRFGPPPTPVNRMLDLALLRFDAAIWQVSEICTDGEYLVLKYADKSRIEQLRRTSTHPVRIANDYQAYIPVPDGSNPTDWLQLARSVLHLD